MPPSTAVVKPSSRIAAAKAVSSAGLVGEVERRLEPAQACGDGPLDDFVVRPDGRVAPADRPIRPVLLDGSVAGRGQCRFELGVA